MDLHTLQTFRHEITGCCGHANDAMFNMVDALLTEDRARSFPEWSQSPWFERRWPSLDEALDDGEIDPQRLYEVFPHVAPSRLWEKIRWVGIDGSRIARPRSHTSTNCSAQHLHHLPECQKPVTSGWPFTTAVVLPVTPRSWTSALSQQRVTTQAPVAQVALAQMKPLVPFLSASPIVVLDRSSDSIWFWYPCRSLPHRGNVIRVKSHRRFSRPAPLPSGKRGSPRKDGDTRRTDAEATHAHPGGQWEGTDEKERPVRLNWWKHLHVTNARSLDLTVIRVERPHASATERDPQVRWFVWIGDPEINLVSLGLGSVLRFRHEHGSRFQKQSLLWDQPRLRTPKQFERWTHLLALAHHHLVLARDLVEPVGKQTPTGAPATGASRDGHILATVGYACPSPATAREIARAGKRDHDGESLALFGHQKDAQTAHFAL